MGLQRAYQALSNYLMHPGTTFAAIGGVLGGLAMGPPGAIIAATGVNLLRNEIDAMPSRLRRSGG